MNSPANNSERDRRPLRFPNWRQALESSTVPVSTRRHYESAISNFLTFCRESHAVASVLLARHYLEARCAQEIDREALAGFFAWDGNGRN